jgi:predicted RNase H-like HicB family nuclease
MTFQVVVEFDPATDAYTAVCPDLPGCASVGDTEAEARRKVEEAIRMHLEAAAASALKDQKPVRVRVNGRGEAAEETPYNLQEPSIEEVLSRLASEVPKADWNNLPADLTDNLDHYLYGTPRR